MIDYDLNNEQSTILTDTFVRGDYNISIRSNLSSIRYTDSYQKERLDKLYAKDYEQLENTSIFEM